MRLIPGSSRPNRGLGRGGALTGNDPGALAASAAIFSGGAFELCFFSCHGGHAKRIPKFAPLEPQLCKRVYVIVPETRSNLGDLIAT